MSAITTLSHRIDAHRPSHNDDSAAHYSTSTLLGGQSLSARAAAMMASSHSTGVRLPRLSVIMGVTSRWRFRPSHANRDLSDNHSSLISYNLKIYDKDHNTVHKWYVSVIQYYSLVKYLTSLVLGRIRNTSFVRVATTMLLPRGSKTSTESIWKYKMFWPK